MAFTKPPSPLDDYGHVPRLQRVTPLSVAKSVFDEARDTIAEWEKSDPRATHIAMVLDGEGEIVTAISGPEIKESAAAGLLFKAATMAVMP